MRALSSQVRLSTGDFRGLLTLPRVRPVVASSLLARLPKGIVPLAVVLLLHETTGGYALPGVVAALIAIGDAASTPWQGRWMDTRGRAVVLVPAALLHAAAMTVMIVAADRPGSGWLLVACAVAAGIGMPPVSGAVKAVWSELVDSDRTHTAYVMESLLQQIIFTAGPVLVSVITVLAGAATTVAVSILMTATGTVWFVIAAAGTTTGRTPATGSRHGALRVPSVRILSAGTLLQGVTFGVRPVGLTALATIAGIPAMVGVLQATFSIGGLAGTFAVPGVREAGRYPRLLLGFALALTPPVLLSLWPSVPVLIVLAVLLVIPGLYLTPLAATSYLLLERRTDPHHRIEAFTWLSTALAVGTSLGSGLAGVLTDIGGPALALAPAPLAVVAAAVWTRRLP